MFRSIVRCIAYNSRKSQIAQIIEEKEKRGADRLKTIVIDAMKEKRAFVENTFLIEGEDVFDKYVKALSDPRALGGEVELVMLVLVLNLNILVYRDSGNGRFKRTGKYMTRNTDARTVRIVYDAELKHYDALLPLEMRLRHFKSTVKETVHRTRTAEERTEDRTEERTTEKTRKRSKKRSFARRVANLMPSCLCFNKAN